MRIITPVAALMLLAVGATNANAHQSSFTYGQLDVSESRRSIRYQLKIKSTDLYEALELDADRDASDAEITAGADKLVAYVDERIDIELLAGACVRTTPPVGLEGSHDRYAVVTFEFTCDTAPQSVAVDYQLFYDLDERHIGLLLVDGETVQLVAPNDNRFEWSFGEHIKGGMGFVRSGIEHIVFGLDHILFLFSLLLMAVITASPLGGWRLRPLREGLGYTAAIVTSFTIAHSITLIAAAMGWVVLSGRLVESAIAASIIYVAVENVVRPDPPRRYVVTFVFGLIHGLGFAAMLRPLLPPGDVVVPLLLFNVGVELGQLALVGIALPLLYLIGRVVGAERYRRLVLPIGAAVLGTLGAIWLVERAFEITLLGL